MDNKIDLSLVSLDELIRAVESRCPSLIASYTLIGPEQKEIDMFFFGKGNRAKSVQLASDLQNAILNNWNGELQTLQRINAEGIL